MCCGRWFHLFGHHVCTVCVYHTCALVEPYPGNQDNTHILYQQQAQLTWCENLFIQLQEHYRGETLTLRKEAQGWGQGFMQVTQVLLLQQFVYIEYVFLCVQSLLSCVAFGYGCENFARYEEQGIGIQWKNIMISSQDDDPYTFIVSIIMMLIDALLYWILTWYIENVFPGEHTFLYFIRLMTSIYILCCNALYS